MRLLCASLAVLLGGTATAAGAPMVVKSPLAPPPAADCPPTAADLVAQRIGNEGQRPQLHLLNDLPPASAYAAVLRQIDGCEAPLIIRYDVENSRGGAQE